MKTPSVLILLAVACLQHFDGCSSQTDRKPDEERDPSPSSSGTNLLLLAKCSSRTDRNPDRKPNPGPSSPGSNLHLLAECCSQIDLNPDCRISTGRPSTSSSTKQHLPDWTFPEEAPSRIRSRSPRRGSTPIKILGYSLKELGYIRIVPYTNHDQKFEFRRYVFPHGKPFRLRAEQGRYFPVPAGEHIVVTTSKGVVFAILEDNECLGGIYTTRRNHPRIKINMMSSEFEMMTQTEMLECPLGRKYPIFPYKFFKSFSKRDSLQSVWNFNSEPQEPPRRDRTSSPPGRPPAQTVLGYSLEKLGYIRLIPEANPNRQFEFRRYIFPAIQPIRLLYDHSFYRLPDREHIVLSTPNGEVFAILEYSGILRGIYRASRQHPRVKFDMISGAIGNMNETELVEVHVGKSYPIFPRWFNKNVSNEDSLQHIYQ